MYPPEVLVRATPEPTLMGETYGALAEWAIALRSSLRQANTDKQSIRDWRRETE